MIAQLLIAAILTTHILGLKKRKYFWLYQIPIMLFLVPSLHLAYSAILSGIIIPNSELQSRDFGKVIALAFLNYFVVIFFYNRILGYILEKNLSKRKVLVSLYLGLLISAALTIFITASID